MLKRRFRLVSSVSRFEHGPTFHFPFSWRFSVEHVQSDMLADVPGSYTYTGRLDVEKWVRVYLIKSTSLVKLFFPLERDTE